MENPKEEGLEQELELILSLLKSDNTLSNLVKMCGSDCDAYRLPDNLNPQLIVKVGDRKTEAEIFERYSHLGLFPKVIFKRDSFTALEYVPHDIYQTDISKNEEVEEFLSLFTILIKDGLIINDLKTSNLVRNLKTGKLQIVDAGNVVKISGTNQAMDSMDGRLWYYLGKISISSNIEGFKKFLYDRVNSD